ncbi:hypothetical protein JMJ77_0007217 [Colletotrichum scovillei]|uniref:Uncharacterized protein n=1 Tax=Colletotrichum scovillei TaxID=1209932 RepID=A0A9P7UIP1_9PEZI|nr:hypothetical protein JMJ77_0007217 [Colletotrichum scovillei]KAG7081348.1 hypothetical protein JMJ78_0003472 [Colletotrichum scovillei]
MGNQSKECSIIHNTLNPLVEGVGAGSPPGEEDRQTDSLNNLGQDADANGVDGALLNKDLGDVLHTY